MKRSGQIVFLAAFVGALAFYALTAPSGLPWNESSHIALAYLGEIVRLPTMPHPVWGRYVQVFGGSVALSVFLSALAAGLLAAVFNRYLGWRFAAGAATAWTFLPWVWNQTVLGQRGACLAAMAVAGVWALNAAALRATRRARGEKTWRVSDGRLAGRVFLGAAVVLALVSATFHDYRLGEPASAYAQGVVEAAAGRIIVMNGVCDDQVVRELATRRDEAGGAGVACVSLRNDDAYRTNLVAWARTAFPGETNLWVAARIGAVTFAEAALKAHPERFYAMDGRSATQAEWERRWKAFEPYLDTRDPFASVARRVFGSEGNGIANGLAERKEDAAAWRLYRRIYEEIDPGNFSALANMNEMIRRGYAANAGEQKKVQRKLDAFLRKEGNRRRLREIVRAAGPVRADYGLAEKVTDEAKQRIAAKIAAGEEVRVDPAVLTLLEWNNEMVRLVNKGELAGAGRIARVILTDPNWRNFVPANAVLGSAAVKEGDYVAGEQFLRVATDTTNAVPAAVLNDYADVLLRVGKVDKAEAMARRAVDVADVKFWVARLTLAEVLIEKSKGKAPAKVRETAKGAGEEWGEARWAQDIRKEITALLKIVLTYAPAQAAETIRTRHREFVR